VRGSATENKKVGVISEKVTELENFVVGNWP
jgi:hypothetical protein